MFLIISILFLNTSAWAEDHLVIQKNKKFSVQALTVKMGDTIVFKNNEKDITHNVYSISPGNEFELRVQKPGTSTPILIDPSTHHEGEMAVECAIHPGMRVVVKIEK